MITKVITVHTEGNMNVCTKFYSTHSSSCWDISLKNHKCQAMGRYRKSQRITSQISRSHCLITLNVCIQFCANSYDSCWDISASKCWSDRQNNTAVHRAMTLAWLKTVISQWSSVFKILPLELGCFNMYLSINCTIPFWLLLCVPPSGPLFQGELQVPAPSSPPKDPAWDQWQEQPDPAEEHGHAGPADAACQCHDAWHAATTYGEGTHTYEHTTATAHGETTYT